ncbi:uncharacterized protein TNCV_3043941 [Trichonephila clavipes]|nr:uncharacterized protein TNCV_3043941 [Trichonephila clavipes]
MDPCVLQKLKQIYRKQFLRTLIEDDTVSLVAKIKQTNMKDVVYWSAESWENVTDQTLIKFWKKLWPTLEYAENQPENDVTSLLQQVQTIPGCEEAGERYINKWIEEDGETAEFLTDDDIAAAVTQEPMEEEGSDDETQCDKKDVVPHADGAAALDLALRYLEQQPDTTPADVLFMRRWRNYASSKRLSSLRQKKITELINNLMEETGLTPLYPCDTYDATSRTCVNIRQLGTTVTLGVQTGNRDGPVRQQVRWFRYYKRRENLPVLKKEFSKEGTPWNINIGGESNELRISPLTEIDFSYNYFVAMVDILHGSDEFERKTKTHQLIKFFIEPIQIGPTIRDALRHGPTGPGPGPRPLWGPEEGVEACVRQ